jgi:hypothetical protein
MPGDEGLREGQEQHVLGVPLSALWVGEVQVGVLEWRSQKRSSAAAADKPPRGIDGKTADLVMGPVGAAVTRPRAISVQ